MSLPSLALLQLTPPC